MLGISPNGDPFFDDPRNLQAIREAIEQAKRGQVTELTPELREKPLGNRLQLQPHHAAHLRERQHTPTKG